jgi:DNA-binding transcriptional LysR family regulator
MRHLLYFMVVAMEEHFHRAAERLGVTQSALSRHVTALEAELGVELFVRGVRGVKLTEAGRMVQEHGDRIFLSIDHLVSKIETYRSGSEGVLRIGMSLASGRADIILRALHRFRELYPNVQLDMRFLFSPAQIEAMADESLDVGFVWDVALKDAHATLDEKFESVPVSRQQVMLCLYDGHPLLKKRKVTIADLRDEPLAWPAHNVGGTHTSDALASAFSDAGVQPNIFAETVGIDMVLDIVKSGVALGFVAVPYPRTEDFHFRPVVGLDIKPTLSMVWMSRAKSAPLRNFIRIVREALAA